QNLVRSSSFPRNLQYFAALVVGEHDGLAGRAQDNESSRRSFRVTLNIVLDLFEVDLAVGIKRRRDGRKNTVQQHGSVGVYKLIKSLIVSSRAGPELRDAKFRRGRRTLTVTTRAGDPRHLTA